jgi:hypothetical protein
MTAIGALPNYWCSGNDNYIFLYSQLIPHLERRIRLLVSPIQQWASTAGLDRQVLRNKAR